MTPEKNIEALHETMKFTGFEEIINPAITFYVSQGIQKFEVANEKFIDDDHRVQHQLRFGYGESKDGERHFYDGMQSTLYAISLPSAIVNGIDVLELEQALRNRTPFDPVAMEGDHAAFLKATAAENEALSARLQQLAVGEPYLFNLLMVKYDPVINFEQDPAWLSEQKTIRDQNTVTQFFTHKKKITAAEAPNMLYGRAVNKEYFDKNSKPYLTWIQLDFDKKTEHGNYEYITFHQNHGFNLDAKLDEFRFVNLDKADAIYNLRKGFIVEADAMVSKITTNDEQQETPVLIKKRLLIETNPGMKTVNLYDDQGNRVPHNVVRKVPVTRQRTTVTRTRPPVAPSKKTSSPEAAENSRPAEEGPAQGGDEPAQDMDGPKQQLFDQHRARPAQHGQPQRKPPQKGRGLH